MKYIGIGCLILSVICSISVGIKWNEFKCKLSNFTILSKILGEDDEKDDKCK